MEIREDSPKAQGCLSYPPVQEEREQALLWQSLWSLSLIHSRKILARVLLNRLQQLLEEDLLPESQCGFRKGRGTVDMTFTARQLQEKCPEQNLDLYTTIIDLTKVFDTVNHNELWKIMSKFTVWTNLLQWLDSSKMACKPVFRMMVTILASFPVTNGVKQGYVLAPTLFSMVFTAVLNDAYRDGRVAVDFHFQTDGKLFNLLELQAKDIAQDFLFVDDCALNASNQSDMQLGMNWSATACNNIGLTITIRKIEVMYQPAPGTPYTEPVITANSQKLAPAEKFVCLGSTLSTEICNVRQRSCLPHSQHSWHSLQDKMWNHEGLSSKTKLKVYRAVECHFCCRPPRPAHAILYMLLISIDPTYAGWEKSFISAGRAPFQICTEVL